MADSLPLLVILCTLVGAGSDLYKYKIGNYALSCFLVLKKAGIHKIVKVNQNGKHI